MASSSLSATTVDLLVDINPPPTAATCLAAAYLAYIDQTFWCGIMDRPLLQRYLYLRYPCCFSPAFLFDCWYLTVYSFETGSYWVLYHLHPVWTASRLTLRRHTFGFVYFDPKLITKYIPKAPKELDQNLCKGLSSRLFVDLWPTGEELIT